MSPIQQGLDTRSARLTASSSCVVSRRLLITCIYKKAFIIHNSEPTTIVCPRLSAIYPLELATVTVQLDCRIRDPELEVRTYICNSSIAKKCIPIEIAVSLERLRLREHFMFKQEDLKPEIRIGG